MAASLTENNLADRFPMALANFDLAALREKILAAYRADDPILTKLREYARLLLTAPAFNRGVRADKRRARLGLQVSRLRAAGEAP